MSDNREILQQQKDYFEVWLQTEYAMKESEPIKPNVSYMALVGIEAILHLVSGIGLFIWSAIRTGGFFYLIELAVMRAFVKIISGGVEEAVLGSGETRVALLLAFAAGIGFEGRAAAIGFTEGRDADEIKENKLDKFLVGSVIGSAAVFSSAPLMETVLTNYESVSTWIYILAAGVTAIAGTIVVFYAGENMGYIALKYRNKKKELLDEFVNESKKFREDARSAFWSSKGGKRFKEDVLSKDETSKDIVQTVDNEKIDTKLTRRQNLGTNYTWAKAKKKLTQEDIHFLRTGEIKEIEKEFGLIPKTAGNWKKYANEQFSPE